MSKIEDILLAYKNYVKECLTLEPTSVYNPKIDTDQAKQALYKDMLAILGEDEHYEGHLLVRQIEHRNQLRQELRTKLKEYYGVEE